ncbi:unnamed protein product [Hermetia illucens]|uniref:Uncharacterized protein n=1 Tax=Hermetia illucens TaxID=343691 RepID=A0A7R8YPZ9_HERIL|nr:uncharacterized protein LOC119661722 [Hermetia illucens]CAD7077909.1 unnamed protein product [Hermetia illucens]
MQSPYKTREQIDADNIETIVDEQLERIHQFKRKIVDAFENVDSTQNNNSKRLKRDLQQVEEIIQHINVPEDDALTVEMFDRGESSRQRNSFEDGHLIIINGEEEIIFRRTMEKFNKLLERLANSKEYYQKEREQYASNAQQEAKEEYRQFLTSVGKGLVNIGQILIHKPE